MVTACFPKKMYRDDAGTVNSDGNMQVVIPGQLFYFRELLSVPDGFTFKADAAAALALVSSS